MGIALAESAARRGAEVTPGGRKRGAARTRRACDVIRVETTAELAGAARDEFANSHVVLMAAAVADFRPEHALPRSWPASRAPGSSSDLEATEDVIGALAAERHPDQTLVGFAAEHGGDVVARARAKLERKGLDAIAVNDVSRADIGFDSDSNEVVIVDAGDEIEVPRASKQQVADAILDRVEALRAQAGAPR